MSARIDQRIIALVAAIVLVLFAAGAARAAVGDTSDQKKDPGTTFDQQAVISGSVGTTPVVYVATGANFPDALGAGPAAASRNAPILLISKTSIPDATKIQLTRLHPHMIIVVGGPAVVSNAVVSQLSPYASGQVMRLGGDNRYETAALIVEDAFPAHQIISGFDTTTKTTTMTTACAMYEDLHVALTASGPGTFIIEANVQLRVGHSAGSENDFTMFLEDSAANCIPDVGYGADASNIAFGPEPTGIYTPWVHLKKIMHVKAWGQHEFSVTGYATQNTGDQGSFYWGYLDVVFIPD